MNQNEETIKYFLYARKSSESEDRQTQSIDDQINHLKSLAKDLDLEIAEVFTESKSAKQPNNRPIFEEMINKIEKGEGGGILCWQINRLSRNPVDSGKINWLLQQGIIKSIQTIDKKYLPEDNVLMFNVESGMANQFILELRKNTKRGLVSKAEKGWLPSRAPQGYLNDVIEKTIIEDPKRFNLVRKMWDLMLTGSYSPPKILDIVNDDWGYLTERRKRDGGRPLSISEVYRIFNSSFYYGYFEYKGKMYKGNHKPMITVDEFERVQELLGNRNKAKQKKYEFAFTGVIRCSYCGCLITAEKKTKLIKSTGEKATYIYYRCTRRKRNFKCKEPSIKVEEIERQIIKEIEKYTISEKFKDWALSVLKEKNEKEAEVNNQSYILLNNKYLELQKQLNSLLQMRLRELISDEEFLREKSKLQEEISKIKIKISQNQDKSENWIELVEKAFCFATYARNSFINGDLKTKREIFSALGQSYTLKEGKIEMEPVKWIIPISNLEKNSQIENKGLELTEIGLNKAKNEANCLVSTQWGG
jgi:site-specific DNA recombinase